MPRQKGPGSQPGGTPKKSRVIEVSHYEVLGVEISASQDQIKQSYRKLSMIHHPDKNPDDPSSAEHKVVLCSSFLTQQMKQINEAYRILGTEDLRRRYDLSLETGTTMVEEGK